METGVVVSLHAGLIQKKKKRGSRDTMTTGQGPEIEEEEGERRREWLTEGKNLLA